MTEQEKYTGLMDQINKLEAKISSLEKSKGKENKNNKGNKGNKSNKGKKNKGDKGKKLCVFKNCPAGSIEKDKLLFGAISFGDDKNLCSFSQCPLGSTKIGAVGDKELCGFDKCPKGATELGNYTISKKK